jgi:hypothetical protein
MAFNISDFQAKVNQYGGFARDNLFMVTISAPPGLAATADISGSELRFFCNSVQLPGLNINTNDVLVQGYGRSEARPIGMGFDPLQTNFLIDSQFKVKDFFHRWLKYIINYDNYDGATSSSGGLNAFEMEYKDSYTGAITVYVYSFQSADIQYIYKFQNAYPTGLGSITTAWENNDTLMSLPVSFTYDIYDVESLNFAPLRTDDSTVLGTREFLLAAGAFGAALNSYSQTQSIQDIINQYSIVSGIRDILN